MKKFLVIAHCSDGDVTITPSGKKYCDSMQEVSDIIENHHLSGVELEIVRVEDKEMEKQVWQGLETIIRGEDDSVDVCGFEMQTHWDGGNIFDFKVEIDDETFELWPYLSEYDYYDILKGGADYALKQMVEDIVIYLQEKLEEE